MLGGSWYIRPCANLANCWSGFVTKTLTVPSSLPPLFSVEAGVVAFSCVLLTKVVVVALFGPNAATAPVTKFVPVMVITVPPLAEEIAGEILVMVGAGRK